MQLIPILQVNLARCIVVLAPKLSYAGMTQYLNIVWKKLKQLNYGEPFCLAARHVTVYKQNDE